MSYFIGSQINSNEERKDPTIREEQNWTTDGSIGDFFWEITDICTAGD